MAISIACACGRVVNAREEKAGQSVKCLFCGAVLIVPEPEASAPRATQEPLGACGACGAPLRAGESCPHCPAIARDEDRLNVPGEAIAVVVFNVILVLLTGLGAVFYVMAPPDARRPSDTIELSIQLGLAFLLLASIPGLLRCNPLAWKAAMAAYTVGLLYCLWGFLGFMLRSGTGVGLTETQSTVISIVLIVQFALNLIPAGLLLKAKEYYG